MTDVPKRNRSGVRGEGDDYQHLVTLNEVLRAIRGNGIRAVTVEADDAGSVDDIVLHDDTGPCRYTQVKHAVDAQTPVSTEYLLKPTRKGQRSLLQRFRDSWQQLKKSRPKMVLVTDRGIDPNDDVFKMLDRKSSQLVPDFADKALDEQRAAWAAHLELNEDELLELLGCLYFKTGREMADERELAQVQLAVLGLAHDQRAIDSAMAFVREWVQERDRTMTVEEMAEALTDRIGRQGDARGLLVVEAIDEHTDKDAADVSLRFVELYDGDDPYARTSLRREADWQDAVWPQLQDAAATFKGRGLREIVVDGPMRLAMWFGAGCALRGVQGFQVSMNQNGQIWSSAEYGISPELTVDVVDISDDPRVGVVVSVATDASQAALEHAKRVGVGRVVLVAPEFGARSSVVQDGPTATAMAERIRNAVRDTLDGRDTEVHLYLATPAGLALLLGNRWNRVRPTVVYEFTAAGYVRTLEVPA